MSISSRVAVIMAGVESNPWAEIPPPAPAEHHESVETVAVAPDASRRVIVVARTKPQGAKLAEARKVDPIAIVTLRSPEAARGMTADDIVWADDLTPEERATIEPHVLPSTAVAQVQTEAS